MLYISVYNNSVRVCLCVCVLNVPYFVNIFYNFAILQSQTPWFKSLYLFVSNIHRKYQWPHHQEKTPRGNELLVFRLSPGKHCTFDVASLLGSVEECVDNRKRFGPSKHVQTNHGWSTWKIESWKSVSRASLSTLYIECIIQIYIEY